MNKKTPQVIGPKTLVDFPTLGISDIPAKVDTGADSSVVSASNIVETDGKLTFNLFNESSPYFTGKIVESKEYTIRSVKNSFGHTELRYKVPMSIRLDGKRIRARLSLADRSNSRYPVLIGRRSIQDKFLVDVGKKLEIKKPEKVPKVLVLVPFGWSKTFEFYDEINSQYGDNLKIDLINYDELVFKVIDNKLSINIGLDGRGVEEYSLIFFKSIMRNLEHAALLYFYAKKLGVKVINSAAQMSPINDKLHQTAFMGMNGIEVPDSMYMSLEHLMKNYTTLKKKLGIPFILKDINGFMGNNNHLIKNKKQFDDACKESDKNSVRLLAQKYIENDGDYRVLVFGKKIKLVIKRTGDKTKTHLNNVSIGAEPELVPTNSLPGDVQKNSIKAASTMQWQVAGVDMIKDKTTGKWYCLEVNNKPQMVNGSFITEKMHGLAEYIKWELSK